MALPNAGISPTRRAANTRPCKNYAERFAASGEKDNSMQKRVFGGTGREVSEIGLGTWQLGSEWGQVDDHTAQEVLAAAVDNGVTFFDTADVYGTGKSEERIGRFLKGVSQEIFVATKLGRFPEPGWPDNFSLDSFRKHVEASLSRLGVEALDLTQTHCLPPDRMQQGDMFEWLRTIKQEGKIKAFGASVESMDEALGCLEQEGLTSLQIIFNIFRQKPLETLFEKAQEKKVALIIRLPVASGLLTGKFTAKATFPEDDHRNFNRDGDCFNVGETFAGLPLAKGVQLVEELKPFVPHDYSLSQFAMRWILDFPAVSVVIPGAKNPKQVAENCSASDLAPLGDECHQNLADFYQQQVADHIRGLY